MYTSLGIPESGPSLYDLNANFYGLKPETYNEYLNGEKSVSEIFPKKAYDSLEDSEESDEEGVPETRNSLKKSHLAYDLASATDSSEVFKSAMPEEEYTKIVELSEFHAKGLKMSRKLSFKDAEKAKVTMDEQMAKQKVEVGAALDKEPRNWTLRMRKAALTTFSALTTTDDKEESVGDVVSEFAEVATTYAKLIISERNLPVAQKTIKPQTSLGGVAGGEKFIHQGILFKFALDIPIGKGWMYGGTKRSDEKAMKAAGREMHGYKLFTTAHVIELNVPLMCIVNYKGFRLIASSLIPINSTTLRYGSSDAGETVLAEDEKLNQLMDQAGSVLGLRSHFVGLPGKGKQIRAPGDIEGHKGKDGNYYIVDFARTCPPEAPSEDKARRLGDSRAVFYKLLRGELLRNPFIREKYPFGLNPDTFTGWNQFEPKKAEDEACLTEVTKFLNQKIISEFAQSLELNFCATITAFDKKRNIKLATDYISNSELHSYGINMRKLGRIREKIDSKRALLRNVIISEAVARTAKNLLRQQMRDLMDKLQTPSDDPFKKPVVNYLNLLVGTSKESDNYWENTLRPELVLRFENIFSKAEEATPLRSLITPQIVVYRLLKMLEFKFNYRTMNYFFEEPTDFTFVLKDFSHMKESTKHSFYKYFSEAISNFKMVMPHVKKLDKRISLSPKDRRLLLNARRASGSALDTAPGCPIVGTIFGLMKLYEALSESPVNYCDLEEAIRRFHMATAKDGGTISVIPIKALVIGLYVKASLVGKQADLLMNDIRSRIEDIKRRDVGVYIPDFMIAPLSDGLMSFYTEIEKELGYGSSPLTPKSTQKLKPALAQQRFYPVEYLLGRHPENWPPDIDAAEREKYLEDSAFEENFKMTKNEFFNLPVWKQAYLKKTVDLF